MGFGMRRHRAAAAADGNERAIAAFFLVGGEALEAAGGLYPPRLLAPIDVATDSLASPVKPGHA